MKRNESQMASCQETGNKEEITVQYDNNPNISPSQPLLIFFCSFILMLSPLIIE